MVRELLRIVNANSIANATQSSEVQDRDRLSQALAIILDVTGLAGTSPSLQLIVELFDSVSGKFVSLGTFVAITAVGTYTYLVGLGIGAASDGVTAVKAFPPPDAYRVRVVGGGTAITDTDYTVSAHRM
jgi:hypothetical protein